MKKLKIDFKNTSGKIKYMNAVNNGPTNPGVRKLKTNFDAYKTAGIPYARNHDASFYSGYGGEHTVDVHRIFKNFDADENDPASYVFGPTDEYLKTIIDAGTKVFYRLGASIEHRYKYGTYPPKDFAKWARICEHIIMHYTEGWADGFKYDIEYWEIWNEPDCTNPDGSSPCWQGTEEEFNELYCTVATYLKNRFPHLKIGGPAFASIQSERKLKIVDKFLNTVSEKKAPLDFFSFHKYADDVKKFAESIQVAEEFTKKYGFAETELILNEWNYVKGWIGSEVEYSFDMQRDIKGSSFIASVMAVGQKSGLDMLMYYDARPCDFNGMFDDKFAPLKGYYPFLMFKELLELGTYIKTEDAEDFYSCLATNGENHSLMLSYYNDDDSSPSKEIVLECENSENKVKAEYYVLDENNDMVLTREEFFTTEKFNIYLKMNLFTTYFIRFTKF